MVTTRPTGVISNIENAGSPCCTAAPLATMLVEVPISVQVPPRTVA